MVNVGNIAVEAEASAIQLFSSVVVVGDFSNEQSQTLVPSGKINLFFK